MKKLICMLLVLCLALTAACAFAEEDYTGEWRLVKARTNGVEIKVGENGLISIIITLKADGTGDFYSAAPVNGKTEETRDNVTWSVSGDKLTMIDSGGGALAFEIKDGMLAIISDTENGSVEMYLSRDASDITSYTKPADIKADSADQFDGTWRTDKVITLGMVTSAEDTGNNATMVIADCVATEDGTDTNGNKTHTVYNCQFEDGVLNSTVTITDEDGATITVPVTFSLLEDGTMCLSMSVSGTNKSGEAIAVDVQLIYVKAEPAA